MSIQAVPANPPIQPFPWIRVAEVFIQTAIRILFIMGCIVAAGAMLPLSLHAFALGPVAVGATFLAGAFFPGKRPPLPKPANVLPPLLEAPRASEVPLPESAPLGVKRKGYNCVFNAIVQFIESDPEIGAWVRMPLEEFVGEEIMNAFLAEFEHEPHPKPPLALGLIRYLGDDPLASRVKVQAALHQFWQVYDAKGPADSQEIREVLHEVNHLIHHSPHAQQEDAEEVLRLIGNAMAKAISIEETHVCQGESPPVPHPQSHPEFLINGLILNGDYENLQAMLDRHFNENIPMEWTGTDGVRRVYQTQVTRRVLEPPPVLRLQIKRFQTVEQRRAESWLTSLNCSCFPILSSGPVTVKKENPVHIPEEVTIPHKDGRLLRYKLASFVVHIGGGWKSGHYIAARKVNEHRYIFDDDRVTLADPQQWDVLSRKAYLLCYLPVE